MLKNTQLAESVAGILLVLIEAGEYLLNCHKDRSYSGYDTVLRDAINMLENVEAVTKVLVSDEPNLNIDKAVPSLLCSLKRISQMDNLRAEGKVEFEFLPLLKGAYKHFYYWGLVHPDKQKILEYESGEIPDIYRDKKLEQARATGNYKYELSIIIIGYNKLDYTKLCIESLFKYMPKDLNYELILVNHGSTDGTKEYFESINPHKQIDILVNGVINGAPDIHGLFESRYLLGVSNDVVLTKNAIENILKCVKSDESIFKVVPTTSNVSNLQAIEATYSSMEEMFEFAENNNTSDKYRWERRTRLCDPIALYDLEKLMFKREFSLFYNAMNQNYQSFPDDKISYIANTYGWKSMLAKDAYCHHFGSITLGDDINGYKKQTGRDFYFEGRQAFFDVFGVDPWGTGFCYDPSLFELLPCDDKGQIKILGVNSGLGSNPLKVQQSIKENAHNLDVKLYNVTDNPANIANLKGLSDEFEFVASVDDMQGIFEGIEFDYIVAEDIAPKYDNIGDIIRKLAKSLKQGGYFAVKIPNPSLKAKLRKEFCASQGNDWLVWKN